MHWRRHALIQLLKLSDLLAVVVSFYVATQFVAFRDGWLTVEELLSVRLKVVNFFLLVGLLVIWHLLFSGFGLYRSRRLSTPWQEARDIVKSTSMGSLAILSVAVLFDIELFTAGYAMAFWVSSTFLILASRLAMRLLVAEIRRRGHNLRNLVIVGTNPRARSFAEKLKASPELGYKVVGFVDDDWSGLEDFHSSGAPLLSACADLQKFVRLHVVDEVVLALPMASAYRQAANIVRCCEEQGVTVRLLSDFFNLSLAKASVEMFHDEPVMTLKTGAMLGGWQMTIKRGLDVLLSSILLLLLMPIFGLLALVIKLGSPGSVFFCQDRVGLNKRRFRLFKFRTMVPGAEARIGELEERNEAGGPVFKLSHDPRVTKVGTFLRRTSLDELPQLVNVLKGDMSLVGPRPLPLRDWNGFEEDWHRRRFSVRPGVTCLWQIAGRSSIPFERWMELDMEYIDQWSLVLDLKILLRTVPAVLRGSGAV